MPLTDTPPTAESSILQSIDRSMALYAKAMEAVLANQRDADERQSRIEIALMRGEAVADGEHSGATDRLNLASLERAQIRAGQADMKSNDIEIMVALNTMKTQMHDLARWFSPWYVRMWEWFKNDMKVKE